MKLHLIKQGRYLVPSLPDDEEKLKKIKSGELLSVDIVRPRNAMFHRKFFALLHVGFDSWNPPSITSKFGQPEKSFEQFREDVTILAGRYESTIRLNGEVRVVAKSISFAKMSQEEFEDLYNSVINVVLDRVLTNYTKGDLLNQVNKIMNFT